jgi:protein tyrosine/serine phosphatase
MRRFLLRFMLPPLAVIAIIGVHIGYQIHSGNFHAVVKGEVYRSAQPTGADITRYAERVGIKSIINLRGGNAGDAWYNEELATAKALGIQHIDFRMKASRELTDEQVATLVQLMRDAPKPLLIHCNAGADRSGFASALYLAAIAKKSKSEAWSELSLYYGHLPFYINETYAMDRTLKRVDEKLWPTSHEVMGASELSTHVATH